MSSQSQEELSILDKAVMAAQESVHSILELARRTHTPVIVYQNGQIERLSPEAFQQDEKAATKSERD
jgi:hypothetical protein